MDAIQVLMWLRTNNQHYRQLTVNDLTERELSIQCLYDIIFYINIQQSSDP